MSGHWEGDEHVLHDKSDHQSKQPKAPKNQVDRKPDDGSGYEGQPEVIATSAHGGAQEYDHDGCDPILPYQEPHQEKKEKNHQRAKSEPSVCRTPSKDSIDGEPGIGGRRPRRGRRTLSTDSNTPSKTP